MKLSRPTVLLVALAGFTVSCVPHAGFPMPAVMAQVAGVSSKAPSVVFIIRHAEKPAGDNKDPNLTVAGFHRADLLPTLFLQQRGSSAPPRLPRPDVIFATDTTKHSNRPIETITPLSQALHLPINHDFADIDTKPLADKILGGQYAGKVVLICWHHGEIPNLAKAFGVTDAPKHWDEAVFDQVWMIEFLNGKPQFSTLPEKLLPGDATQ